MHLIHNDEAEKELIGMAWVTKTPKPTPSDKLLLVRTQLLLLPKQLHQPGARRSHTRPSIQIPRGHSLQTTTNACYEFAVGLTGGPSLCGYLFAERWHNVGQKKAFCAAMEGGNGIIGPVFLI